MENVNHPNHYQGSCAESWDLTVLEWGPEYAIAAWVIQAQQYYDRHKGKNGVEDLYKAMEFIKHAEKVYEWYSNENSVIVDMNGNDFWQRVDFLKEMIFKAYKESDACRNEDSNCKDKSDTDDPNAGIYY